MEDTMGMEETTKARIRAVAQSLIDKNCVFFIGAGVARDDANAPTFHDIAVELIGRPEFPEDLRVLKRDDGRLAEGVSPSQVVEYFSDHVASQAQLHHFLDKRFERLRPTGRVYKILVQLANKDLFDHLYTTNVEHYLKDCLGHRAELISLSELQAHLYRQRGKIKIVCVHGNLKTGNARLTETDILTAYAQLPAILGSLTEDMRRKTLVFVGYSFRDETIRFLLGYFLAAHGGKVPEPWYAVFPAHVPASQRRSEQLARAKWRLLEAIWERRNVRLIDRSAHAFFTEVHTEVLLLDSLLTAERVTEHLGLSMEEVARDVPDLAQDLGFNQHETLRIVADLLGVPEE